MSSLLDLVQAFHGRRALIIGDVMLDTYVEGVATRLCTEGPVPIVRRTAEEHAPGGAANAAANARALGAETRLVGVIGRDTMGEICRRALRDRGLEDRWLIEGAAVSTLHKLRVLANEQYVVRCDAGDVGIEGTPVERQLMARIDALLSWAELLIVSDYCHGVFTDDVVARLGSAAAARSIPVVVDSKDLRRFSRFGATMVTPNQAEAGALAPIERAPLNLATMRQVAQHILRQVDTAYVAITLAEDGVLLAGRDGTVHIPASPVIGAKDVGAGDSFTAAAALTLAAGGTAEQAARIGVIAGGIAVTKPRTAVVGQNELLQRVSLSVHAPPESLAELTAHLEEERRRGRTIVFTNGVFDILHAGHVYFLGEARKHGDVLVVAVNSDRSARRLKGKNRPINVERDRLALVAALDAVDHAFLFDEETPSDIIRLIRPDVHVKGGDYQGQTLPEAGAVAEVGGRIEIVPLAGSLSTSDVIDRILTLVPRPVGAQA